MHSEQATIQIIYNGIAAAAKSIGVSKRTLQRWLRLTYTITSREGREVQQPRVVVNESQTAKCGALILTAVYDAHGKRIWHARRQLPKTIAEYKEQKEDIESILKQIEDFCKRDAAEDFAEQLETNRNN